MVCHSFAPLVVLLTALLFLQVRCSPVIFQKRGICATEDPDASFLRAVQRVKTKESRPDSTASEARQGPIEVATWFHIITSKTEAGQISDEMINAQVNNVFMPVYFGCLVLTLPAVCHSTRLLRGRCDQIQIARYHPLRQRYMGTQ